MSDYVLTTVSGNVVEFTNPNPDSLDIDDIAHNLSHACRWGGAVDQFYSVAQHCVLVHDCVLASLGRTHVTLREDYRQIALAALLHDASEYLLCDMPTPVKYHPLMEGYRILERRLQGAVGDKYGLPAKLFKCQMIKEADMRVRIAEAEDFSDMPLSMACCSHEQTAPRWPEYNLQPWQSPHAKRIFLSRFENLKRNTNGKTAIV
jgi:5'-deoxynucleotidase YfbR-like HD superfamily hydrolase